MQVVQLACLRSDPSGYSHHTHQVQTRSAGYFGGLDLERIHFLWLSATGQGLLNRTKVRLNREGRKGNYQTIFIMGDFNRCIKNEGYQK